LTTSDRGPKTSKNQAKPRETHFLDCGFSAMFLHPFKRRENPVDEETLFSSLETFGALERLKQLYARRGC
jgi:hypothetical protein